MGTVAPEPNHRPYRNRLVLPKPLLHGASGAWDEIALVAGGVIILVIVWWLEARVARKEIKSGDTAPPED